MAISGDYPTPVTVNGFSCKNCTDVDYAKKHVDPAHPKDGPYGVNARDQPLRNDSAVKFGGRLTELNDVVPIGRTSIATLGGLGARLDITA